MFPTLFCFRRNQNVKDIMKGLSLGPKNLSHFDITTQFQHLFFLGDLNYRLEGIEPTVRNIIRFFQKQVHLKCSCEISLVFFFRCTSRNICDLFIFFLEFNSRFKHLLAIIYSQQIINKVSQLEKSPDNQRDFNSLLFHDQLLRSQRDNDVFCHFREY